MINKENTILLRKDHMETFSKLNRDQAGELIQIIARYALDGDVTKSDDWGVDALSILIRGSIDRENMHIKNWRNK